MEPSSGGDGAAWDSVAGFGGMQCVGGVRVELGVIIRSRARGGLRAWW